MRREVVEQTYLCTMVHRILTTLVLYGSAAFTALAAGPLPGQIKNLVTFGDSYTDVVSVLIRTLRTFGSSPYDDRVGWSCRRRYSMACIRRPGRSLQALPVRQVWRNMLQQSHRASIPIRVRESASAVLHGEVERHASFEPRRHDLHVVDRHQRRRRECAPDGFATSGCERC